MRKWQVATAKFFSKLFPWLVAACAVIALVITASLPFPLPEPSTIIVQGVDEQQRQNEHLLRLSLQNQMQRQIAQIQKMLTSIKTEVEDANFDIGRFLTQIEEHCQQLREIRENLEKIERLRKSELYVR
jgi:chromosome segregation ATPase